MSMYSTRHKRRLVRNQTEMEMSTLYGSCEDVNMQANREPQSKLYPVGPVVVTNKQLSDAGKSSVLLHAHAEVSNESCDSGSSFHAQITFDDTVNVQVPNGNATQASPSILEDLREWATSYRVNQNAVSALLCLLQKHTELKIPKDCRTLLKTPRKSDIATLANGNYCHFHLEHALFQICKEREVRDLSLSNIDLLINVDGLPLTRSSSASLWPILCSDTITKKVYIIGAYFGYQKPQNPNEYLKPFVDELIDVINTGYVYGNNTIAVYLLALICDAPAKALVLSVKNHTGYNSCTKCLTEGEYIDNCVSFPLTECKSYKNLRTDESFAKNIYEDYQMGQTVLCNVPNFGLVSNVPLDYMHLICLGVTRKLLLLWLKGPLSVRLSSNKINKISINLQQIATSTPKEIARRPRPLSEINHWKAVEFRTFLLYTGPVVLKDILDKNIYTNFLTLHVAIRILTSSEYSKQTLYVNYAEELLLHFVQSFQIIYGKSKVSHNVHNLLHICDDVRKFGNLDEFSAFRFESFMSTIKRTLRKADKPLQQLSNRYSEMQTCAKKYTNNDIILRMEHNEGPLVSKLNGVNFRQYKIYSSEKHFIRCNDSRNNCFMLKNDQIIIIENILQKIDSDDIFIVAKCLKKLDDLYTSPCKSSDLKITVSNVTEHHLLIWSMDQIDKKVWKSTHNHNYVLFPLLH